MASDWRVVLDTREATGAPYPNIYLHVLAESPEEAIDYVLQHHVGICAGNARLLDGWRVYSAWAVPEGSVVSVDIEPIDAPAFRRTIRREYVRNGE